MTNSSHHILAIEIGSSRVKVGWFPSTGACEKAAPDLPIVATPRSLPEPSEIFRIDHKRGYKSRKGEKLWTGEVQSRLNELSLPGDVICIVAAVHAAAAYALQERVLKRQDWSRVISLTRNDLPIEVDLKEPSRVGVDRLLTALAANRVRQPDRPAIVVDMGTAMTVNLIAADGVFQGGAILAGPMTGPQTLHVMTLSLPTTLPLLGHEALEAAPDAVGKSTEAAMAAGAYWGAVGAARELIARMAAACEHPPEIFLTGGASAGLAPFIGLGDAPARHVPHLVLSGIRLAAEGILAP